MGAGADHFDVKLFGADYAYTVDGGALGELEYENFNAAGAKLHVYGRSVHPGSAKGKMKNAILIAQEFQKLLPVEQNPMYTEGYEGFFHLDALSGNVEETTADYIIRDHNRQLFEQKKELFMSCADFLNWKYGEGTVVVDMKDSYYNMREISSPKYLRSAAVQMEPDCPSWGCPVRTCAQVERITTADTSTPAYSPWRRLRNC